MSLLESTTNKKCQNTKKYTDKYRLPVAYDFSDVTIRHLVSIIGNHKRHDKTRLKIEFHSSLRLLSLQDIILLRETCKEKNIEIIDHFKLDVIDYCKAVDISTQRGQNPTNIEYARHSRGSPWLSILIRLQADNPNLNFIIMKQILSKNFDLNLDSTRTGETILFHLIRIFDVKSLKYVFNSTKSKNRININANYFNKNGQTPLFVALELHTEEKNKRIAAKSKEMKDLQMTKKNEKQNDKQSEKQAETEMEEVTISLQAQKNESENVNAVLGKISNAGSIQKRLQQTQKEIGKHMYVKFCLFEILHSLLMY